MVGNFENPQFSCGVYQIVPQGRKGWGKRARRFGRYHQIPPPWPGFVGPKRFPCPALKQISLDRPAVPTGDHNAKPCHRRGILRAMIGPQRRNCPHPPTARPLSPFKIRTHQSFVTLKRKVAHGPLKKPFRLRHCPSIQGEDRYFSSDRRN